VAGRETKKDQDARTVYQGVGHSVIRARISLGSP
jgi:hypothetical protein